LGPGCETWYAIEPRGYVCVDGKRATLDADDPELVAIREVSPKVDQPWPHRYAESLGAERYMTLPTEKEQRQREAGFEAHLKKVAAARSGGERDPSLEGVDLTPGNDSVFALPSLPPGLQIQRTTLRRRSAIAYSRQIEHLGRTFLLTADLTYLPKDRAKLYDKVVFQGIHLTKNEGRLPIAFFRKRDRPRYRKNGAGEMEEDGVFRRLGHVELTGKHELLGETEYLETRDAGFFVKESDAVLPKPSDRTPWGAEVGKPDDTRFQPKGRKTWIEVSVFGGWLIAYEGTEPVFVTLISPGRGGTPIEGKDPVETASTPTGRFNVTGKFTTATMEAPHELIHSDVPWTQNFSGPHALHGAYWHDGWGELKSGGCINVSPIDGKWLYSFTEPAVPKDWHAVRWDPKNEASTTLMVHR
jgi:hypothetical protein